MVGWYLKSQQISRDFMQKEQAKLLCKGHLKQQAAPGLSSWGGITGLSALNSVLEYSLHPFVVIPGRVENASSDSSWAEQNAATQSHLHSQNTVAAQLCPCDMSGSPSDHPHGDMWGLLWHWSRIVPTRPAKLLAGNRWLRSRLRSCKRLNYGFWHYGRMTPRRLVLPSKTPCAVSNGLIRRFGWGLPDFGCRGVGCRWQTQFVSWLFYLRARWAGLITPLRKRH